MPDPAGPARAYDLPRLTALLDGIALETNPALVKQKSRDFFWYSPVLKRQLDSVTGDLVATPKNEAEVIRILGACHALRVPVTPRGAGTGNYGQAMPLAGGLVLNLADMDKVRAIAPGRVTAEPGAILADIDKATRAHSGQELRLHPSTYNTASLGGYIAGGSVGAGSINWGGLRDLGNVLGIRVVTMETEPRVLQLRGFDLQKVTHAYGTNGVITEVEMPLTAAYDWIDVLAAFDGWLDAVRFGELLAHQDGLLVKEIAPIEAPVPYDYFLRHRKFLRREQSVVVVMVAPHAMEAFTAFASRQKAEIVYRSDTATPAEKQGLPPAYELTWNHTTLRGLRVDPTITYLQALYPSPSAEAAVRMAKRFGAEVPGHVEFVRYDGGIAGFGLPIVRFTTEERLEEIIRIHEAEGCPIFNPHRYTLEEGGMKQTDEIQLAFKSLADPDGLLNPGKMIAWENPDFDFAGTKTYLFPALAG